MMIILYWLVGLVVGFMIAGNCYIELSPCDFDDCVVIGIVFIVSMVLWPISLGLVLIGVVARFILRKFGLCS